MSERCALYAIEWAGVRRRLLRRLKLMSSKQYSSAGIWDFMDSILYKKCRHIVHLNICQWSVRGFHHETHQNGTDEAHLKDCRS